MRLLLNGEDVTDAIGFVTLQAEQGSGDHATLKSLFEPVTYQVTLNDVDPEALSLYYGSGTFNEWPEPAPQHSLTIISQEQVSGKPGRPAHIKGFKAWITRANRKAWRKYALEHRAWRLAGRPDKTVECVTYFPRASISLETDLQEHA